MYDEEKPEWLGDDGEFVMPVDHRYGVYSPFRRGYWWRLATVGVSAFVFVGGIVVFMWML